MMLGCVDNTKTPWSIVAYSFGALGAMVRGWCTDQQRGEQNSHHQGKRGDVMPHTVHAHTCAASRISHLESRICGAACGDTVYRKLILIRAHLTSSSSHGCTTTYTVVCMYCTWVQHRPLQHPFTACQIKGNTAIPQYCKTNNVKMKPLHSVRGASATPSTGLLCRYRYRRPIRKTIRAQPLVCTESTESTDSRMAEQRLWRRR